MANIKLKAKLIKPISNRFITFKEGAEGIATKLHNGLYEFSSIPTTAFWVVCSKNDFIEIK